MVNKVIYHSWTRGELIPGEISVDYLSVPVDRVAFLALTFMLVGMLPFCDNFSFCLVLIFIVHFIYLDADENLVEKQ